MSRTYRLNELAEACGVKPRTIRYYVQRGLLPAPTFRGPETAYDHDHLLRLQAIKRLQERFWSLEAIASHLAELRGEALETWMNRLDASSGGDTTPPELSRLTLEVPAREGLDTRTVVMPSSGQGLDTREGTPASLGATRLPPFEASLPALDFVEGVTRWVRYQLAPGIEIHLDPERSPSATQDFLEDVLDLARRYRLRSF
jgi:DNA-binding transcriptional MerR regulator